MFSSPGATPLQVHEAVDEAFERAFESVEPYLNKTGELGGVTPYSEVTAFKAASCATNQRLAHAAHGMLAA